MSAHYQQGARLRLKTNRAQSKGLGYAPWNEQEDLNVAKYELIVQCVPANRKHFFTEKKSRTAARTRRSTTKWH